MKQSAGKSRSWFWHWVVNNRLVSVLTVTLLILLILLVLSKVTWLFSPIDVVFEIVALPLLIAGVFYYLLNPVVDWLEQRFHVSRTWGTLGLFVIIFALLILGLVRIIPVIQSQVTTLIHDWPIYWQRLTVEVDHLFNDRRVSLIQQQLTQFNDDIAKQSSKLMSGLAQNTWASVGDIVSRITSVLVALITAPFILFYLLRDGHQLPAYLAHFVPSKPRARLQHILIEMNAQIARYVRGQLIVAFFVAVMFYVGFAIVGLKFALLLGLIAGILNLIPYLGSFLAMIPAVIVAAFVSPWMLVKVLIVFIIEQTIEGRLISPLVLGSSLKIHPLTIIFILLASGKLFGVLGVVLGIPGYAVIRVIFSEAFHWYRSFSGLYPDDDPKEEIYEEN